MLRVTSERLRMSSPDVDDDEKDIVTRTTYDAVGLTESETDPNKNVTNYERDELMRLRKRILPEVELPEGQPPQRYEQTLIYGENSGFPAFALGNWKPVRVVTPRGFPTDTKLDAVSRPLRVVRRRDDGQTVNPSDPARSAQGDLLPEPCVEYEYNALGRKTTVFEHTEDADANALILTTHLFYDSFGRTVLSTVDMNGDGVHPGLGLSDEDPLDDLSGLTFDPNDLDLHTQTTYDKAGNVIKTVDPEGNATVFIYDGAGRRTNEKYAPVDVYDPVLDQTTPTVQTEKVMEYDDNGNVTIVTDVREHHARTWYDERNRPWKVILDLNADGLFEEDGSDPVTIKAYDIVGNAIAVTDPLGNTTRTEYDRAGRAVLVRRPDVHVYTPGEEPGNPKRTVGQPVLRTEYDGNGNVTRVTDPLGRVTEDVYDALNRLRFSTAAKGGDDEVETESQYNENGDLKAVILHNVVDWNARPQKTEYGYDAFDRKVSETLPPSEQGDPEIRQTTWTYYRNGTVGAIAAPEETTTEHVYDRANRIVRTVLRSEATQDATPEVETRWFTYDKAGNVKEVVDRDFDGDGNGDVTTYVYDAQYRVLSETRTPADGGPGGCAVLSSYDKAGNRTRCEYPDPDTVRALRSHYDPRGLLVKVDDDHDPQTRTTQYTYDLGGNRLACTLPNGSAEVNTFDALNRLESRRVYHVDGGGAESELHAVEYGHDLVGNKTTADESYLDGQEAKTRALSYAYDSLNRLTGEDSLTAVGDGVPTLVERFFVYDRAGNRLSRTGASRGRTLN